MVNLYTKFVVSRCTRYEAMSGGANAENGVVRGHSRSWAIRQCHCSIERMRSYVCKHFSRDPVYDRHGQTGGHRAVACTMLA